MAPTRVPACLSARGSPPTRPPGAVPGHGTALRDKANLQPATPPGQRVRWSAPPPFSSPGIGATVTGAGAEHAWSARARYRRRLPEADSPGLANLRCDLRRGGTVVARCRAPQPAGISSDRPLAGVLLQMPWTQGTRKQVALPVALARSRPASQGHRGGAVGIDALPLPVADAYRRRRSQAGQRRHHDDRSPLTTTGNPPGCPVPSGLGGVRAIVPAQDRLPGRVTGHTAVAGRSRSHKRRRTRRWSAVRACAAGPPRPARPR